MKFLSSAALMAMALAASGSAVAYQIEVGGEYNTQERDGVTETEFVFKGNYYLEPLNTEGVVLSEAAFLKKASHVGVLYSNYELEVDEVNFSEDYNGFGAQGRYIYSSDRDYIFEGQLSFGDVDTISIAGGFYLDANTEIVGGFSTIDYDSDSGSSEQLDLFFARYKTMTSFNKFDTLLAQGEAYILEGDLGLDVDADVFLDRNTSVGIGTGIFFGEDTEVPFEVKGKHFLTEELAFYGSIGAEDITDFDPAFTIGVIGRF